MVEQLTPTRGVDNDDFPGYSLVYVIISVYMRCPLPFLLTAIPYLHRIVVHAHHWHSMLILTALTRRYSVLPVWTSAGDPAPSALQAPFPNTHPYPKRITNLTLLSSSRALLIKQKKKNSHDSS